MPGFVCLVYNSGMNDEAALLAAITVNPDEDTPRLAYADWLDEYDRPVRAEFIRVQVEVARVEELPRIELNKHIPLFERQQELIDTHRAELLGPLSALPGECVEMRRGFVARVNVPVGAFLEHAALLPTLRPLPEVRVSEVAARLTDFVRCPALGLVTELSGYARPAAGFQPLPDEEEVLAAAERLVRLAVLDLEGCGLTDAFCDQLGDFSLPAMTTLDLSQNALTDVGVENLLRVTHHPARLRRLVLGGNDITDIGALALAARWPTGAGDRLENLNLRFTHIGSLGQASLLERFGGRVDLF